MRKTLRYKIPGLLDSAAPAICLALFLCALLITGDIENDPDREARSLRTREAIESLPDLLGPNSEWIQVMEVPVPTSQAAMLDLNAHVSRLYQRLGLYPPVQATVFIANSKDARSMAGHHPPNCYPATGWKMDEDESTSHEFPVVGAKKLPASLYKFGRGGDSGPRLWVVNGFLMPQGVAVATLGETKEQTSRASRSRLGLTQYQIVIRGDREVSKVIQYASEILESLPQELLVGESDEKSIVLKTEDGDGQ